MRRCGGSQIAQTAVQHSSFCTLHNTITFSPLDHYHRDRALGLDTGVIAGSENASPLLFCKPSLGPSIMCDKFIDEEPARVPNVLGEDTATTCS